MPSVLANAPFEQTTLTAQVQTGTAPGEYGNPEPVYDDVELAAVLAPFKATQLERLEGADANAFRARGELVDPLDFPSGVRVGSVLTVSFAGRSYEATLTNVIPNDLKGVAFGAYFEVDMKAV